MRFVALVLLATLSLAAWASPEPAAAPRTQIGHVGGVPVYLDQVQGATEQERGESLRRLFVSAAIRDWAKAYESEWRLTEAETDALVRKIRAVNACRGTPAMAPEQERFIASFLGGGAKVQRVIYLRNGRGRILFQQAGAEAYDATRVLLEKLQAEGKFAITDPALRRQALDYWYSQSLLQPDPGPEKAFVLDTLVSDCTPAAAAAAAKPGS